MFGTIPHPLSLAAQQAIELQQPLGLLPQGGRRDGAGRKRGTHPRDPHRSRQPLSSTHPCHVTLTLRRGIPWLRTVRFGREFERSLRAVRDRTRFRVAHAVARVFGLRGSVLPDRFHLHVLRSPREVRDPPVSRARTWLLRVGWRRHGRVAVTEVPGRH
jgi:hypothetical protein